MISVSPIKSDCALVVWALSIYRQRLFRRPELLLCTGKRSASLTPPRSMASVPGARRNEADMGRGRARRATQRTGQTDQSEAASWLEDPPFPSLSTSVFRQNVHA